jgi:hypothetical protein
VAEEHGQKVATEPSTLRIGKGMGGTTGGFSKLMLVDMLCKSVRLNSETDITARPMIWVQVKVKMNMELKMMRNAR